MNREDLEAELDAAGFPGATAELDPTSSEAQSDEAVATATEHPRPLEGEKLVAALETWVTNDWCEDWNQLPNRDELLCLARKKPEFAYATEQHMRDLRAKFGTEESKRGGRPRKPG